MSEFGSRGDFGGSKPFWFERMWVHMPHFFNITEESWNSTTMSSPIYILIMNNKKTKEVLYQRNKIEGSEQTIDEKKNPK